MLKIKNISVRLGNFSLRDINFSVAKGEYFVLLGMSGAGKSVLLQIIAGMIRQKEGQIILNNRDISHERIQKRSVGLVFQDSSVFPHMSVFDNIAYPLRSRSLKKDEIRNTVLNLTELTNISALLNRSPEGLSGGEQQRVALARALALKPGCLLLDEPISSLDVQLRGEMRSLLRKINQTGQTIVHVTHDYEEAAILANRIGVIESGRLVQTGTTDEVFHHPKSEFVANFVGIRNFFEGDLKGNGDSLKIFSTAGHELLLLSEDYDGQGHVIIRGEDIILSEVEPDSTAVNKMKGTVTGIEPARVGVEVFIDCGIVFSSLVSKESIQKFSLETGKEIWMSFKASAVKFIPK
jgi:molybdopterin-binding protein